MESGTHWSRNRCTRWGSWSTTNSWRETHKISLGVVYVHGRHVKTAKYFSQENCFLHESPLNAFEKFLHPLKYQEALYVSGSLYLIIFKTECFPYYMSYYKATAIFVMHSSRTFNFTSFLLPLVSQDSLSRDFQVSKK